ncbi:fructose-2,6-bisphosphatase TIGAR B isoform X2 [Kryptolebias marmoratus]|uniref:fructose-2,6-bisphosphatase TIGAR B isoform X2 n=1 Tax=Kryptolebias marmoratus TaxID=37003 RepID=UPI000D52FBC2|nr:fructose-2,6-bisphosphatase TIGAR B isoform X2 [Kryptolebias marmoratus]
MLTFSLTLVRHGETQYNREKLLQGQGVDTPLSEVGVQQGEAVGQYLKDVRFNKVFVSNLQRAMQTAEMILRNNTHCSGMEMVLEPLLRERGFGVAEGRHKEDLKNMANAAGQSCRDYTPPGGETLDQAALEELRNVRPQDLLAPGSMSSFLVWVQEGRESLQVLCVTKPQPTATHSEAWKMTTLGAAAAFLECGRKTERFRFHLGGSRDCFRPGCGRLGSRGHVRFMEISWSDTAPL